MKSRVEAAAFQGQGCAAWVWWMPAEGRDAALPKSTMQLSDPWVKGPEGYIWSVAPVFCEMANRPLHIQLTPLSRRCGWARCRA